jgi:hypothetical protein
MSPYGTKWRECGQGFGSGSAWIRINLSCWIRIRIQIGRAKMTHQNRKKARIFMFLNTGCSLLRAEGFSCSLGVLYGGLGISKLQFLIKKIEIKFPALIFFSFMSSNPGSGSGIRIRNKKKCWIRIRIKSMRIRNPERGYGLSTPSKRELVYFYYY